MKTVEELKWPLPNEPLTREEMVKKIEGDIPEKTLEKEIKALF